MKHIGIIQADTVVGDVVHNMDHMEELIRKAVRKPTDILVLPETWNTGFIAKDELKEMANGQEAIEMVQALAKEYHVNVVAGSVAYVENDKLYNRTAIINDGGEIISTYDKMHGFSPAKEDQYFTGGTQIHQFEIAGLKGSSVTCYDIRFPELIRMSALQGIDILFVPAQWPITRLSHWQILNQARAIENQMYLCAVNGVGKIGKLPMAGHSMMIDPLGEILIDLGETERIQHIAIDETAVEALRAKFHVYQDRRPELYNIK